MHSVEMPAIIYHINSNHHVLQGSLGRKDSSVLRNVSNSSVLTGFFNFIS